MAEGGDVTGGVIISIVYVGGGGPVLGGWGVVPVFDFYSGLYVPL